MKFLTWKKGQGAYKFYFSTEADMYISDKKHFKLFFNYSTD